MSNLPPPNPRKPIDPLIQQRVANLRRNQQTAAADATPAARQKPAGRRVKPARASKVASLALSAVTTVGLAGVFAHSAQADGAGTLTISGTATGTDGSGTTATTAPATTATTTAAGDTTATSAGPNTTAAPATTAAAGVLDGTYVGSASNNRFGTVQVQAVYSGGALTDVQVIQYPNGDRRSLSISQQALPWLIDESVTAQSASVDTISGATYTSKSYKQSLQSAIDAAMAASGLA